MIHTQAEDHIFLNDLKKLREKFEVRQHLLNSIQGQ